MQHVKFVFIVLFLILTGCSQKVKTINIYNEVDTRLEDNQPFYRQGLKTNISEVMDGKNMVILFTIKGFGTRLKGKYDGESQDFQLLNVNAEKINDYPVKFYCDNLKLYTDSGEQLKLLDGCNENIIVETKANSNFPSFLTFSYPKNKFQSLFVDAKINVLEPKKINPEDIDPVHIGIKDITKYEYKIIGKRNYE